MSATRALVAVNSPWYSKINWVQLASIVLNGLITLVGGQVLGLDPELQVKLLGVLQLIQGVSTIIIKTYFTPTVTPQSL
jgi:hypothetical protein